MRTAASEPTIKRINLICASSAWMASSESACTMHPVKVRNSLLRTGLRNNQIVQFERLELERFCFWTTLAVGWRHHSNRDPGSRRWRQAELLCGGRILSPRFLRDPQIRIHDPDVVPVLCDCRLPREHF